MFKILFKGVQHLYNTYIIIIIIIFFPLFLTLQSSVHGAAPAYSDIAIESSSFQMLPKQNAKSSRNPQNKKQNPFDNSFKKMKHR